MRRIGKLLGGIILAGTVAATLSAQGAEAVKLGTGPAYELIGKVAVMHEGRIKPLDTVAREEVKQVYGRETVKLLNLREEVEKFLDPNNSSKSKGTDWPVERWEPVGVFLGWTVYPEYWDDQPFILVDFLPLKRLILAETVATRLKGIADKATTPALEKDKLQKLATAGEVSTATLTAILRESKLPIEDRTTIAELAAKSSEEHKWLTPHELDEARITDKGHTHGLMEWAAELDDQQRTFTANPQSAPRLTEVEKRALEVARRLSTYKAYSGERLQTSDLILIMPRPVNAKYLATTNQAIKETIQRKDGREGASARDLPLMKLDSLKAFSTYWNFVPSSERHYPTEDAKFDERYTSWLRQNSVWVPLKALLRSKPEELIEAGYPESEVRAFLDAYHALEQAESSSPGKVSQEVASRFLAASRSLGEAVNPSKYPTVPMIERETHFNSMNPFWQAPYAYGAALVLLAISLGFASATGKKTIPELMGSTIYRLGLLSLGLGIALEVYGFYLRVRITGWAPVTNMYETVVWVALVAAVLSFIFEMIYRRTFTALAGSAVALLGTITAANVPLLDPTIKSLQPVLRSNLWLTIHVLTEVSSYAAFGLAWGLGLITTLYYLTATYRRSPTFLELATPLVPGLLLLGVGGAGVAASYGMLGPRWATSVALSSSSSGSQPTGVDAGFILLSGVALLGEWISLATLLALVSEGLNRLTFRDHADPSDDTWEPDAPETSKTVKLDARGRAMQQTLANVKPLSNFIYRTMQVGVLLIAAGTILGGVWADYSWGRFWGWDPKEVWALITLLIYLVPLHGRFAGWIGNFGLVASSVFCFLSVIMAWYGVNFVLGVGLHSYGFTEGGSQGIMMVILSGVMSFPLAAGWRRFLAQRV
jgi:ABC-type transport system involved in cytochrome c biogenesis permease subunit